MALLRKITTLRQVLDQADKTDWDGASSSCAVPIPASLDDKRDVLRGLINRRVNLQAEIARLAGELDSVDEQIEKHQIEFSREMLLLQIPAPLATKDNPPELPRVNEDGQTTRHDGDA
jgi:hypothetical protein